jgi:hypothetical protein
LPSSSTPNRAGVLCHIAGDAVFHPTIKKILSAVGLPTEAPKLRPARPPPAQGGGEGGDWLN